MPNVSSVHPPNDFPAYGSTALRSTLDTAHLAPLPLPFGISVQRTWPGHRSRTCHIRLWCKPVPGPSDTLVFGYLRHNGERT